MDANFLKIWNEHLTAVAALQDNPPPDYPAMIVRLFELAKKYVELSVVEGDVRPMPNVIPSKPFAVLQTTSNFSVSALIYRPNEVDTLKDTIVYDGEQILLIDNLFPRPLPTVGLYLWVPSNGYMTKGASVILDPGQKEYTYKLSITGTPLIATVEVNKV